MRNMRVTGPEKSGTLKSVPSPGEEVWLKASVMGGFWAASEIVIGSSLHNLRVPFSGSLLTFLGVIIAASFFRIWPVRGLIWRAGLICALMKSVSPSAVILGPMIGIFTEALLMEIVFILFGNRLIAFITGGIAAMFSTLVHKLVTLLILYGMNLVRILENLYFFSVRQIGTGELPPWLLVGIFGGFYLLAGVTGGVLGFRIGNRVIPVKNQVLTEEKAENPGFLKDPPPARPCAWIMLILNLLLIPAGLILLNKLNIWLSTLYALVFVAYIVIVYPSSVHKVRKPLFWVQFVLVVLFASFFLGNIHPDQPGLSVTGMLEGLKMCYRALLVYFGFSAVSIEMRNPFITQLLVNRGMEKLYVSVGLAFSVMPSIAKKITGPGKMFTSPASSMVELLNDAENWLEKLRGK